jgi:ketosteroid isomerase-like protein
VRWTITGTSAWSRSYDGKQAVQAELLTQLFAKFTDGYTNEAQRVIAAGEHVVVEAGGRASTKAGVPYENTYCWIFRLAAGKVKEITEYCDTLLFAEVLGGPREGFPAPDLLRPEPSAARRGPAFVSRAGHRVFSRVSAGPNIVAGSRCPGREVRDEVQVGSGRAPVRVRCGAGDGSSEAAKRKPLQFEQHDLYIEYNATDGDAGLQLAADAEDWKRFELLDTKGKPLIEVGASGRLRRPFGLSELFLEASEPPFTKVPFGTFKKRFPKGRYRFRGVASDGRRLVGSDRLSFVVPAAPKVTFPTKGALVDPDGFKVTWAPVTRPAGVKIATYQVIVSQGDRELSMYLPPSATSATIPGEFLEPGTKTEGELLAREKSGNQTITAFPSFRTR